MDLSTTYMGFQLPHPLVPGASPMADDLDVVRRLEDAGAPMIVMHSLFEEQIVAEELAMTRAIETGEDSYAEALSYLPNPELFKLGPAEYLEQVRKIKNAVAVPVIGSINGVTEGGWLEYARLIQEAGADGLELNLFQIEAKPGSSGEQVERRQLSIVRAVKHSVHIPLAVKLSPFYSSIAHFAGQLDQIGIDALVLFNRFYEPDIDVEQLEVIPVNLLSNPSELLLRLRWIGILSGRIKASLAATGGVHSGVEAVKAIMVGAQAVQMVSVLLKRGPRYLKSVRDELAQWLDEHGYESLRQMQGSMSQARCPDSKAFERGNYVKILQSWRAE
jgi:dihydroorotate dehydrogenase (fumarate)